MGKGTSKERAPAAAVPPQQPSAAAEEPPDDGALDAVFAALHAHDPADGWRTEGVLGPHAVSVFCDTVGAPPDSFAILVVAWNMGAQRMGYFTHAEFAAGMRKMRWNATLGPGLEGLARWGSDVLPPLVAAVRTSPDMFDVVDYAFSFACEPGQRALSKEAAHGMLAVVYPPDTPHVTAFHAFLMASDSVRGLSRDQWTSFYDFVCTYPSDGVYPDYDAASSWPVLLDDFVAWRAAAAPPHAAAAL